MINKLTLNLIVKEWKIKPFISFKGTLLLIPILAIIIMYATTNIIQPINHNLFIKNSDFLQLSYLQENHVSSFRKFKEPIFLGDVIEFEPGVRVGDFVRLNLFIIDKTENNWQTGFFTDKNIIKGSFSNTKLNNHMEIILSYDSAKLLGKNIGDILYIRIDGRIFEDVSEKFILMEEFELTEEDFNDFYFPVKITGVMKPFKNGLGLLRVDEEFLSLLDEKNITHKTDYNYISFDDTDVTNAEKIILKEEFKYNLFDNSFKFEIVIGTIGIIVVFLLIRREIKFTLNHRLRDIGILLSLGASKRTIYKTFWVEQFIKILITSLLSVTIYKYFLIDRFLGNLFGHYIGLELFIAILLICLIIGFFSISISLREIKSRIQHLPIVEIVSKKPE